MENIAARKKHWGFTNHRKWQDNMTSGRKSKLFADIWKVTGIYRFSDRKS